MSPGPTRVAMAKLIKNQLRANGITQADFAKRVHVSPKHLCEVLGGHAGTDQLDYWANALDCTFEVRLVRRGRE